MTAGILVNKGRQLSGVSDDLADAYCGGCQQQLKLGHRPGCSGIMDDIFEVMGKGDETRCFDCGRPSSLGHSQDCTEQINRFGVQMGGW